MTDVGVPVDLPDRALAAQDKARILREALPWIVRWAGRTVVVKYGGNAMSDSPALGGSGAPTSSSDSERAGAQPLDASFAADVALLHHVGLRVVVVHGGGPQINALSQRLGLQPRFVDGRRVTDSATLDVVKMVLLGQVNPHLVGLVSAAGVPAAGVAGTDAGLLRARQADPALGYVGEIEAVDPRVLVELLDAGVVPVVATVARGAARGAARGEARGEGRGEGGATYNVNADTAAGAIAVALEADKLLYLSNVPGLYEDFGTPESSLLSELSLERLRGMLDAGELNTGMVPKVRSIVDALEGGVGQAHLLDGRVEHALLLEIFTDEGVGTMVTNAKGTR